MTGLVARSRGWRPRSRESRGFSMVELLLTAVLAGIIFSAMVPLFANALRANSGDELRVDSANIAQDRIEQVRLLDFADITTANLNYAPSPTANPFGDGRFGPTYTQVGDTRPYTVTYEVASLTDANAKRVTVTVSRPGRDGYVTKADTIVDNPAEGDTEWTEEEPTELSITVWFDNWTYVKSPGISVARVQTNVTPNATTTPAPSYQMPTAANQEVTWTGLTGGPNYTYTISVYSKKASYVLHPIPFRLWSNGSWKIDTYPGGD